ncbi:MAG: molybdate ABC transporter substrate-binding protein, partial [Deltaproteobacteria bacterium]|nr:molybdate ABC transporter substrate-binding protein [Deltaproteobacteria bacterium]
MKAIFSSLVLLVCLAMPLARAAAAEVAVSAAASLTNAFTEVKETFERGNPGIKIVTNFASSNALLAQIESGAPVDVFASADQATMDKAAEKKLLLASSRRDFARNGLVLIVPAASTGKAAKAEDLTQAAYAKIAVGNPDSVPAGRYTREVLQARKLWDALM